MGIETSELLTISEVGLSLPWWIHAGVRGWEGFLVSKTEGEEGRQLTGSDVSGAGFLEPWALKGSEGIRSCALL